VCNLVVEGGCFGGKGRGFESWDGILGVFLMWFYYIYIYIYM
jgi:hypothetical protein